MGNAKDSSHVAKPRQAENFIILVLGLLGLATAVVLGPAVITSFYRGWQSDRAYRAIVEAAAEGDSSGVLSYSNEFVRNLDPSRDRRRIPQIRRLVEESAILRSMDLLDNGAVEQASKVLGDGVQIASRLGNVEEDL